MKKKKRNHSRGRLCHISIEDTLNLDQIERAAILEALRRSNGVQKDAVRLLGISPRVINYKIKKYNLSA